MLRVGGEGDRAYTLDNHSVLPSPKEVELWVDLPVSGLSVSVFGAGLLSPVASVTIKETQHESFRLRI